MTGIPKKSRVWCGIVLAAAVWWGTLGIPIQPAQAAADREQTLLAMSLLDSVLGKKEEPKPATPPPKPDAPKAPASPAKPVTTQSAPTAPTGGAPASAPGPAPVVVPGTAPKPAVPPPGAPVAPSAGSSVPVKSGAATPATPPSVSQPAMGAKPGTALTPATPAGSMVPPPTSKPETMTDDYTYDPKSRRDPFQSMVLMLKIAKAQSEMPPLQRFEINDMKLLGIIWGGYGYYGLIQTPDGKGYTVKEGMLLGANNGTIKSISEKRILVSEPTMEVTGKRSTREVEILLRTKEGTQ